MAILLFMQSPHRVLVAAIRNGGRCPCPRCRIPKTKFSQVGMQRDTTQRATLLRVDTHAQRFDIQSARQIIYESNYRVNADAVERILKEDSLVPTLVRPTEPALFSISDELFQSQNAFSSRLSAFDFDLYPILVVDLMHEFELGVWKNLFAHLIRILHASDPALVNQLDQRYMQMIYYSASVCQHFLRALGIGRCQHSDEMVYEGFPQIALRRSGWLPVTMKTFYRWVLFDCRRLLP